MGIIRGNPKNVSIHHSAVAFSTGNLTELKARAASHNNHHKANSELWKNTTNGEYGYKWIRYHYMISNDGSLIQVQDTKYALYANGDGGQSVPNSFNMTAVNIMFEGNYETQKPTEAMMRTAVQLIRDIEKRFNIDPRVRAHKELSSTATACAGKNIGTSQSGWLKQLIANVNDKNYSTTPPPPPPPPEPPPVVEPPAPPEPTECDKQVIELKAQINALNEGLRASNEHLKEALERVEFLESTLAIREKELADLEGDYDRTLEERNRFENDYMEAVKKLKECEADNWFVQLRDKIYELWGEYKDRIIKFLKRE